jgi:hypothetical protein
MMVADSVVIDLVFSSQSCDLLIEAAEMLRAIAADYPGDARFQAVVDKVFDAVRLSECAGD